MKTPSFLELKSLVELLQEDLVSSQLQEIHCVDDAVVLTFYRFHLEPKLKYLTFDLDRPFPFLGYTDLHPWPKQKKSKPVGLFLNAHAKNKHLTRIDLVEDLGRVVRFIFGQQPGGVKVDFRLIPKQPNLIVTTIDEKKEKSISWYPVLDLKNQEIGPAMVIDEVRSVPFLTQQWFQRRSPVAKQSLESKTNIPALSAYQKWYKQKQKDLEKKKNAVEGVKRQIDLLKNEPWREVGEFLKNQGLQHVPLEWTQFVQFEKGLSWNIQVCFEKAKHAVGKINGAQERLILLEQDILKMSHLTEADFHKDLQAKSRQVQQSPQRKLEGKYRKLMLSETMIAYLGKSAQDNLDLLRKAKSWDVWIHLKDYPSAHAIIHRQKDQKISDTEIFKCSEWLVKESLSDKKTALGGKFAVVFTECRHVRPIKGDKLGRVTYHEAREILIAL